MLLDLVLLKFVLNAEQLYGFKKAVSHVIIVAIVNAIEDGNEQLDNALKQKENEWNQKAIPWRDTRSTR